MDERNLRGNYRKLEQLRRQKSKQADKNILTDGDEAFCRSFGFEE